MPEPPDHALVGVFNPADTSVPPVVFVRDDAAQENQGEAAPLWFSEDIYSSWVDLLDVAAEVNGEVVRLHRADDPAVTNPFNAGVEAAAKAIEAHAESIGWYEGGGVWADAIEEARKAVKP